MKKDNTAIFLLGAVVIGGAIYFATRNSAPTFTPPPNSGYNATTLPNGQPAWVNTTGTVLNAAGQILGSITQVLAAINAGQTPKPQEASVGACGCHTMPVRQYGYNQNFSGPLVL